ncbi:GNAT family N-acetyltransferase [Candidatus Saccharibacteria bacterium]|nr:GNAT family N-acetyltransferase [Candidatus Saccharibacteria bacterium]
MKFKHGTRRRAIEYEKDIAAQWKKNKTFEKSVEQRPAESAYVFYDGPPFITGVPHHGTLLSSIVKDAVARYWTMKGKRVERVWGWDCHGLPAENFVEKQLGITDRRQIIVSRQSKIRFEQDFKKSAEVIRKVAKWRQEKGFPHGDTWGLEHTLPAALLKEYKNKAEFYTIYNQDTLIGAFILKDDDYDGMWQEQPAENSQYLYKFAILPQFQGQGYADSVLDLLKQRSIENRRDSFRLDTGEHQPGLIKLYERNGFKKICNWKSETTKLNWLLYEWKTEEAAELESSCEKDGSGSACRTISLEDYIIKARESMVANSETWENVISRIGRWVDFKGAYKTMDKNFMESVWWAFKQLYEAGKIYEGEKVLMYDTKFATPVSKNEVTMDNDAYQTVTDPSAYVKFKVAEDNLIDNNNGLEIASKILKNMSNIKYGMKLKNGKLCEGNHSGKEWWNNYVLQSPSEVQKNKLGVCWDQVEFERKMFEDKNISVKTFAIVYYDHKNKSYPNHTFLIFRSNKKIYWLEHSWLPFEGIHEYNSEEELLKDVKKKFIKNTKYIPENYDEKELCVYEYQRPKFGISPPQFYKHFEGGENIVEFTAQNTYLLAWTTTPWTLPGNTALAVNPKLKYIEVKVGNEGLILAKKLVEKVLVDDKNQPLDYEITREMTGADLVGLEYEGLFGGGGKVWTADFVEDAGGTGIVHIAPAYGEDDFELAKKHGIPLLHTIDDNGYYLPEFAERLHTIGVKNTDDNGIEVWAANKFIAKRLHEQGVVWKIDYIQHEYPFNPRSGQRIMYRAIPSWFFDVQGQKPLMLEQNENINWFPKHIKQGRFAKNIEQAPDWNISRDRFWATAMPVWKGDKGTVKVIGSYAELKELSGVELDDYHRPWVDDITFDINGEHFTRIEKVLDCWFESGSMPFAQLHYPFENKEKFEKNYPADFITEYVAQVRAWFYYVHVVNTALFGQNAFKNCIVTGTLAGNDGRKMSKSLGNYTDPNELMDKFSADSLRFLLLSCPILSGEDFSLQDKDVSDVARKLSMVWNMYDFFTMYAEVDGWESDNSESLTLNPDDVKSPLDKWIISRLHQLTDHLTRHMDDYNLPEACSEVLPFLDDASNWYVRRSRRRFWKSEDDSDKSEAYRTLHYVLVKLGVLLAPFTPFLAEELYQKLAGGESVHLLDWPEVGEIDKKALSDMTRTREIIERGLSLRMNRDDEFGQIKVRQPLSRLEYPGDKLDGFYEQIIVEEVNIKVVDNAKELVLDKKITLDLKREGQAREIIRVIQNARKEAGFNVDDRIVVNITTSNSIIEKTINEYRDTIAAEILATKFADNDGYKTTVSVNGAELIIQLKKS